MMGEVDGIPRPRPWARRDELGEDRRWSPPVEEPKGDGRRGEEGYMVGLGLGELRVRNRQG